MVDALEVIRLRRPAVIEARRQRRAVLAGWGLACLLIFDAWAVWPYMEQELPRLEPWKIACIFSADAIGLGLFLWYFGRHCVLLEPMRDKPLTPRSRWHVRWFYIALLLGLAFDLGATLYFKAEEKDEYHRATSTIASVQSLTTRHGSRARNWTFHCRYHTGATEHQSFVRIHKGEQEPLPPTLPQHTRDLLMRDQQPISLPIRYLPEWPTRTWVQGVSEDENGLSWFSLCTLFFQALILGLVALFSWSSLSELRQRNLIPWWLELHEAIPAAVQIVVMGFVGTLFRLFG